MANPSGKINSLSQFNLVICDEHLMTIDEVANKYETDLKNGLTSEKVQINAQKHGLNQLTPPKKTPGIIKFIKLLFSGFSLLLWVGAILCIVSYFINKDEQTLYLGFALIFVVIITVAFTYYQESKSSAIMESFKSLIPHVAHVIRDGKLIEIDSKEIVLGDVIEVIGGNQVAADIRIIEAYGCKFDNSSITGESEPQYRTTELKPEIENPLEAENLAFFSSYCTEGRARGIAIRIGDQTVIGKIASLTQQQESQTSIAREINRFIKIITIFALFLGVTFLLLSLIMGYSFINAIIFFIGIIVANVPEGLIATVTVCLTLTAKSLSKKNCLVKNLEAVETLGSTSIICSDKTGTLTQNKMHVSHVWFNNQVMEPLVEGNLQMLKQSLADDKRFQDFLRVTTLCSKANIEIDSNHQKIFHGDASEVALLKFLIKIGVNIEKIRQRHPIVHEIPFNSTNKFHITVHDISQFEPHAKHKYLICLKGAPEIILKLCRSVVLQEQCLKLKTETKQDLDSVCSFFASMGERVLAFSEYYTNDYKSFLDTKDDKKTLGEKFLDEMNFTLLGVMSLIDPPRPEVPDAVEKCRQAGVRVFMVTGDHPITAKAIAKQVGILSHDDRKITILNDEILQEFLGHSTNHSLLKDDQDQTIEEYEEKSIVIPGWILNQFTEDQLDHLVENYREIVFARTSPQQKLLIVDSCQRLGHIVAMTGDGVNDSPALKKANIGISMGINGSDVSKEAADIILMDDNFASIVVGIEEGRVIFDNLKKSISYVLASNFAEIVPFIFYVIFGFPLALGTITILCIDLGTDILPSISLAYEEAESDIMKRKPRNPKEDHLVTGKLIHRSYFQLGMIQAAAGFFTYFCVMGDHGFYISQLFHLRRYWDDKNYIIIDLNNQPWSYDKRKILEYTCQTSYFVSIVVCQWMDLILCKTRVNSIFHQGMTNHVLNSSLIVETFIALFLVYCPGVEKVLKLYPLKWWYGWFTSIPFTIYMLIYDETRRWFIRNRPKGFFARETCQ
ncbi:sodium/potassium-transporting ATPase subunit alpha-1-like [Dermatophagoides pteronyssinus]|uniref:Sodium/potassium-transporting ATPase subunit alpha n=2 Tax=Dermatophagoides pteronyssinus TaxID=6956 RepID=A0A6P6Y476_DERPT|nr:sodium/potassium-transporting ATPase subunit alpha-1-like [Dermatophagoides pteronyssinus]